MTEGQEITHTDIHWTYLSELDTPEEIEDYKNYWHRGRYFSWAQEEYTDEIYLPAYEAKPPAIMLVIHAVVDGQDYTLGPVPVDIVPGSEERK